MSIRQDAPFSGAKISTTPRFGQDSCHTCSCSSYSCHHLLVIGVNHRKT